ncbi:MAG: tetratricopeptide repeat protein, partial [Acidobacteria bacterium]|nr:tetratricopeptide repeat protein [Acidobacteriota bacterium]
ITLTLVGGGCAASEAQKAAQDGERLYDRGDYDAALPLLEKATEKGLKDGQLFYQLAYVYERNGQREKAQSYREKAAPLLEKQARSAKGTLEDSYYLTALYVQLQRASDMQKAAQEGIKKFEKRTDLSGADLFRLGRLYQFAGNAALSATTYRKAAESMAAEKDPNPILYALAITADAGTDIQARRYGEAARKLEQAEAVNPKSPPPLFQVALMELGAGHYAEARERFAREPANTEAQYGADVAARLERCGGRLEALPDGKTFQEMSNDEVQQALDAAAGTFREAKSAADTDPAKVQVAEKLFFSLAAEWMLRGQPLREISLSGSYADLIRR